MVLKLDRTGRISRLHSDDAQKARNKTITQKIPFFSRFPRLALVDGDDPGYGARRPFGYVAFVHYCNLQALPWITSLGLQGFCWDTPCRPSP